MRCLFLVVGARRVGRQPGFKRGDQFGQWRFQVGQQRVDFIGRPAFPQHMLQRFRAGLDGGSAHVAGDALGGVGQPLRR